MVNTECELFRIVPREKLDYLFQHSCASAALDYTFLGSEDVYRPVSDYVSKDKVILDLGCSFAVQSWYFRPFKKYIGVDVCMDDNSVIHTENSAYYFTSIQEFIQDIFPKLGYGLDDVYAILSYVPDWQAEELVLKTFPHCRVVYPRRINVTRK